MINLDCNAQLKALGAKWNGAEWVAPELAKPEFDAIKAKYYSDLVAVELTITDENRDEGTWLGTAHAQAICGYVLATAYGRDSGAKLAAGVAVISGGFDSGGSAKNYRCTIKGDGARVRCKVGRAMLDDIRAREGSDLVVLDDTHPTQASELEIQKAVELLTKNGFTVTK